MILVAELIIFIFVMLGKMAKWNIEEETISVKDLVLINQVMTQLCFVLIWVIKMFQDYTIVQKKPLLVLQNNMEKIKFIS